MSSDMKQIVKINMVYDAETMKDEVTKDEPPAFEDQTLEATDTLIIGQEPVACHFFIF